MTPYASPNGIGSLAGRLTDPQDRETYARLVSYFHALPPGDEFRQQMEMLGLLSLIGQRIPDALAEFLAELRAHTKASAECHAQVDSRLSKLPAEITDGVDVAAIAKGMSEAFRQQLAATALQDTASLLRASARDIKALSGEISASLQPVMREYRSTASTISTELMKLVSASREVENHNHRLIERDQSNRWFWQCLLAMTLLLLGTLCGILIEKRQTTSALLELYSQVDRIQTRVPPPVTVAPAHKRK